MIDETIKRLELVLDELGISKEVAADMILPLARRGVSVVQDSGEQDPEAIAAKRILETLSMWIDKGEQRAVVVDRPFAKFRAQVFCKSRMPRFFAGETVQDALAQATQHLMLEDE